MVYVFYRQAPVSGTGQSGGFLFLLAAIDPLAPQGGTTSPEPVMLNLFQQLSGFISPRRSR